MATIYRCDRCGFESRVFHEHTRVQLHGTLSTLGVEWDICRPCATALAEFMETGASTSPTAPPEAP